MTAPDTRPADDLLTRADRFVYDRATDPNDDGDNPTASLIADLAAEVRRLRARLTDALALIDAIAAARQTEGDTDA